MNGITQALAAALLLAAAPDAQALYRAEAPATSSLPAGAGTVQITNLGLALGGNDDGVLDGRFFAFLVDEADQGADLDGNGFVGGKVLHVHDLALGRTTNVGLGVAGNALRPLQLDGGRVLFRVAEDDVSLNGDGDTQDVVVQLHDALTGETSNLGLAVGSGLVSIGTTPASICGQSALIEVSEPAHGVDLNGDGDALDTAFQTIDFGPRSRLRPWTRSTGLWSVGLPFASHTHPWTERRHFLDGGALFVGVDEVFLGRDANGDGDALDANVLQVQDPTSRIWRNLGLSLGKLSVQVVAGDGFDAFAVHEASQGGIDLNGDGDQFDSVLHLLDPSDGSVLNAFTALADPPESGEELAVVFAQEVAQGGTDFNLDGDGDDEVVGVYDAASDTLFNTFLAIPGGYGRRAVAFDGRRVAIAVSEESQGETDLNGDGDAEDQVVHVFDAATNSVTNTGIDGFLLGFSDGVLAFGVWEYRQGQTDLNGDGDTTDFVYHLATLP